MRSLNECILLYQREIQAGDIVFAYQGIIKLLKALQCALAKAHPDHRIKTLYTGHFDVSYFTFTPPLLSAHHLKIAVLYRHPLNQFEICLAADNHQLQLAWYPKLCQMKLNNYQLIKPTGKVDVLLSQVIDSHPDFDDQPALISRLQKQAEAFSTDMQIIINDL